MKKQFLFILFFVFTLKSFAQPFLAWEDHQGYLGTQNNGKFIKVDQDNRVYTANENGSLCRYNLEGDTVWTRPQQTIPNITDLLIDGNKDIIGIGHTQFNGGMWVVIKFDSLGNVLWTANVDGPSGNYDIPNAADLDQNNNIYITGKESNNFIGTFYTAKINTDGNLIWAKSYRGPYLPEEHEGTDIAVFDENNIYAIGFEYRNSTTTDMKLIKYNNLGDTVWTKRFSWDEEFGDMWQTLDRGLFVDTDSDGNVYIVSTRFGPNQLITFKFDPNGVQLWQNTLFPTTYYSYARDFLVDENGNSYITGSLENHNLVTTLDDTMYVLKRNAQGQIQWLYKYQGSNACQGYALELTDNYLYVAGIKYACNGCSRYHVVQKIDLNGNMIWDYIEDSQISISYGGTYDIAVDTFGGVYLTGADESVTFQENTYQYKLYDCDYSYDVVISDSSNHLKTYFIADTYQWVRCDSSFVEILGQNFNEFTATENGIYALVVGMGECTDTSNCIEINSFTSVGIEKIESNETPILLRITDILWRNSEEKSNEVLFYHFSDGTIRKRLKLD